MILRQIGLWQSRHDAAGTWVRHLQQQRRTDLNVQTHPFVLHEGRFTFAYHHDYVGTESPCFKTTLGVKFAKTIERVGRDYVGDSIVKETALRRGERNGLVGDRLPMSEAVDVRPVFLQRRGIGSGFGQRNLSLEVARKNRIRV